MSGRMRFLLASLVGLVLAGIVHIGVVLSIPRLAEGDPLTRARASESLDHPLRIHTLPTRDAPAPAPAPEEAWLPNPDPSSAIGVCAYDLDDGPMRVSAKTGSLALSLAVPSRRGAFYAVTDQAAVRGSLELVVMTRAQYDEALASEEEASRDLRIVAPDHKGFAVVRVLAGLPSQRALANAAVDAVSCSIDSPDEPTAPEPSR